MRPNPTFPIFRGDKATIGAYRRCIEKIASPVQRQPSPIQFSEDPTEFFPTGNARSYAKSFSDEFYNKQHQEFVEALISFIDARKLLLGDRLKGAGIPCVLFTTISLNGVEHCLVAISGTQFISSTDVKKTQSEEQREISQNISVFWNTMSDYIKMLSARKKISYILLGQRSENYNVLVRSVLGVINAPQERLYDTHKSCAEKATFNFLQKLFAVYGAGLVVTGSQAYTLHPRGMREIPPCIACKENIPAIKVLLTRAEQLSPCRTLSTPRAQSVSAAWISPLKTTPPREVNAAPLFRLSQ